MHKSLENIEKGLLEMYLQNPEIAHDELEAAGYNVDELTREGMSIIKQYKFKTQAQENKIRLQNLYSKAMALLKEKIHYNSQEALAILNTYKVNVQFRNIESLTDEELNDILKDVDVVKLIENLEKK